MKRTLNERRKRLALPLAYIAARMDKHVGWVSKAQSAKPGTSPHLRLRTFIVKQELMMRAAGRS